MLESVSKKISIQEAVETCLAKNHIFAAYRLPNRKQTELVVQKSPIKQVIGSEAIFSNLHGFLVAPFSETSMCPPFLIHPDIYASDSLSEEQFTEIKEIDAVPIASNESHIPTAINYSGYLKQINQVISQIESGVFEKVVLSRVKIVEGNYVNKLTHIFGQLIENYPNAFVFMFNAGPHLWIGATPEPLLRAENGSMFTVSLAGTRTFEERNLNIGAWNSKERLEQEYVTRYISKVLSQFNLIHVKLEGPYTKRAGNLVHLRTDFSFRSEELRECLGDFLNNLHPTPAVCGMPRKESLALISELEVHKREYYAGYLGPVGLNDRLALFVNLRCMKVLQKNLALFVGGGITADSVPADEWQETEIKAETLLSVIGQV